MKYNLLALVLAFVAISCSSDGEKDYREENDAEIAAYLIENNLNATRSESGLYYVIEDEGAGKNISMISDVTLTYKGYTTNGEVFDTTGDDLASFNLQNVIRGFAEGLSYLNEGGKATLLIPAHLGYGSKDHGNILAGSVLIFEVEVYSPEMIAEKNDADIQAYIEKEGLDATKTESGLYYTVDEPGTGAQPTDESIVKIVYKGTFLNGTKFGESGSVGVDIELSDVIDGWKEGIPLFKEGGKGKLIIPAHLGYGSYNYSGMPGGSELVFEIELLKVN